MTGGAESVAQATARAFGGALIFSLPLLMTMEMWQLGHSAHPLRLALFLAVSVPALVALSHYSGFEATFGWKEDLADAFAALAIGAVTAAVMLLVLGVIAVTDGPAEIVGKVAIQTVPAAIGAMAARRQLGDQEEEREEDEEGPASYPGELFLMGMGALYVAFNVAPTEEMVLIGYRMTPWHAIALVLLSLTVLHVFVYAVGFRGQHAPERETRRGLLLHFTLPGFAVAVGVSLYVLWTFGRLDGIDVREAAATVAVLAFPACIGAAVARLIV